MTNDVKLAIINRYLEAKRKGVLEVIDGTFEGIRARLLEALGPKPPLDLPWRYVTSREQWADVDRDVSQSCVVGHLRGAPLPPCGATVHLFVGDVPRSPEIGATVIRTVKAAHLVAKGHPRDSEDDLVLLTFYGAQVDAKKR